MTRSTLQRTVLDGGYCIGCGACASHEGGPLRVVLAEDGRYRAELAPGAEVHEPVLRVCPFAPEGAHEHELAAAFPGTEDRRIGRFTACYAGAAASEETRANGSSGGFVTWLAQALLAEGVVDGVVHVAPVEGAVARPLFAYTVSRTAERIRAGAKTRYYPVEMSAVLQEVRASPGRYLFVGLPCFVKAVRRLAREDATLAARVAFTLAIFCGHQKSAAYAELLAWQCGVPPDRLAGIDFRRKLPGHPANEYAVEVRDARGVTVTRPVHGMLGAHWRHGFFKYKACDFCDDVAGETADVAVGDAWLPPYVRDGRGTNVVVVRAPALHARIERARREGHLVLDAVTAGDVARSQAASFRERRHLLRFRLGAADAAGEWRPPKRVRSLPPLGPRMRGALALAAALREASHTSFAQARREARLDVFEAAMAPLLAEDARLGRGLAPRLAGALGWLRGLGARAAAWARGT